ncbi:hypothetical protein LCGC14_0409280 [marine sediment metagenome]|uniref:Type II secretion system protein GspC N-terminal domain-containing protein n=1 Tax=marine sediment metagenome TaxID=412755 RepID=A0A0F9W3G1_9ZZZZ|nr:hypothetical protein [Phycisphaerae bacterium]HDZ44308.1 hypothetical protein [Phycisphaerae bacterium]
MVTLTRPARQRLLRAAIGALLLGLLWPASAMLLGPPALVGRPDRQRDQTTRAAAAAPTTAPSLAVIESYAVIFGRDLRRPLVDPVPPKPSPPPKPKLGLRLEGTVLEPDHNYAFFKTKSGETKIASEGQIVEGAEVISISEGEVTVSFGDQMISLKTKAKANAERGNR